METREIEKQFNSWDDVLYPELRATIRGTYYGVISQEQMDEECFYIAQRAVAAFKFPRISTEYEVVHYVRSEEDPNVFMEVDEDDDNFDDSIPHAYFLNKLTHDEIEVIVAWMKVYWCEYQLSNADNFEDMYTDANIKTYSRANMVDKNLKLLKEYREYARDLENRYSRVTSVRKPSLGDVNSDE
jgi:hypothetical protein